MLASDIFLIFAINNRHVGIHRQETSWASARGDWDSASATIMSPMTRRTSACLKLNFIIKIGYPDKWKDYSGLQVNDSLSLYENLQKIGRWATDDEIAKHVNKKVDKTEWAFFDPTADDAANYGAIGGVIGHEMSHGFDDQGAQFDKYGNQHNWWTAQDKKNFDARTKVLADWFSSFEVLPGVKVNGKQTLGENIGDNGGLNIAFRALQNSLKTNPLPVKDGFTPEQRFFLAWGRVWASNMTDELVKYLLPSMSTLPTTPASMAPCR